MKRNFKKNGQFSQGTKCLLSLVCLLLTLGVRAQKTDTLYTSQGKLYQIITTDGKSKRVQTFTYSGNLESVAFFKNGKKHGQQKEYTPYGKLKVEANYQDGYLDGLYKEYYPSGELQQELHYKIFSMDGQKQSLLEGEAKYYHKNGYIVREGNYQKGAEEGKWKFYNQNGQLTEEKVYENGKMAGTHVTYYPNGQIQSKAEVYEKVTIDNVYHEQLIKGWNRRYYDNGQEESFTEIKNGKPTGNVKRWYREGGLQTISELVDEKHRVSKFYNEKGELSLYLEEMQTLKDGYVRWVKHGEERNYKDGNLSAIAHYAEGERHGKFEQYGADGQIASSGRLHRGKMVGTYKNYYENGRLKEVQQKDYVIYWQGDTGIVDQGWHRQYAENGQLTFETLYDLGQETYQARYSEEGALSTRSFQVHDLKWTQEYYPKGELKTDHAASRHYNQKGVWYINNVQQLMQITSFYKTEETYELKKDGAGGLLSTKKNGEPFEPTAEEEQKLVFAKNDEFYNGKSYSGDFELTYGNATKRMSFSLKDSLPDGNFQLFRPDGSLAFYGEVQNGLSRGISFFLSPAGDTVMWQRKGERSERHRKEWLADSSYRAERFTERGVRLYSYETYPGGAPKTLVDEENKIYKSWRPDGRIASESYPAEGSEDRTVHIDYYPNGQLRSKYYMENKQRIGAFEFFHENGQLNTRSFYVNGKQEGLYESYFEDGSLRSKGKMVDNKKEGDWKVSREGKIDDEYYKDDKLQIKPPTEACACIDTALASGHFGYLNLLKYQLEYRKYKNLHFSFLQPLDSATYHSLFYKSAYGSSIDVITFQPLTFQFDKEGENTITINACHTKGYISSIHFLFWQHSGSESLRLILENAQLRYVFKTNFFEQGEHGHSISLLIENDRAEFNHVNHIELEDTYVEPCFEPIRAGSWRLTSANLRLLPKVTPEKTSFWFQNESFDLLKLENLPEEFMLGSSGAGKNPMSKSNNHHTQRGFSTAFNSQPLNGFVAKSGTGTFELKGEPLSFGLRYMWLTNTWSSGVFDIEVSNLEENGSFTIKTETGKVLKSSLEKLKQQFKEDGFKNLAVEQYQNQDRIRVEFFNP